MTPDALFKQSQVYRQAIIEMQRRCLLSGTTARPIVETDRADAMAAELLATLLVTRQDGKAAGSVFEQLLEDYPAKLLGWILAAHWSGPLKVPTAQIDSANRASWRASHEPIEPYAKRIEKNGDDAKPIILVKTPSGKIIIVDGHHRFLAFEQLGLPAIGYLAEVHVEKGPWDELHSSQKKGGDPDGSSSFLPSIDKSDAARDDFDPEQPRGEDGRFGEGSGEGTSSAPKAEASGDDDWQPPASAAPLFSAKSLQGLGRDAAQAHADPDKLFEDARQAHEAQLDLLNRGTGLDKDLGATAVRGDLMAPKAFDDAVTGAATATGPVVLIGPMKTRESAERKTRDENDGDWTKLSDVVRASVAVDSIDQLHEVVGHLQDRGMTLAKLPSDRFATPLESGYRDLNLKVAYPNGHIGEIQLHLKGVLAVKSALHKLYEVSRELEPKMAKRAMTQADWHTYDQAMRQQRKDYGDAWRKAGGT